MVEGPFSVANFHLDPFKPPGYVHTELFTRPTISDVFHLRILETANQS